MRTFYTKKEEIINTLSHSAGIVLGVIMGIIWLVMCYLHSDGWASLGISLYMFGMLGSYISSTLYHAWPAHSKWKEHLRKWDHAAIYWHIAGSYSPLVMIAMWDVGIWGKLLFCLNWGIAIAGTIMSFRHLKEHSNLETLCFIAMGLSVLIAFKPLLSCVSPAAVGWVIAEGVFYITGALFYTLHNRRYMHSLFHFFVLAGSICHIIAVWDVLNELW